MKKKLIGLSGSVLGFGASALAPVMVFAQTTTTGANNPGVKCAATGTVTNIQNFICKLNEILNAIIPFLIALGIVYFVWGVISYVIADEEAAKEKGRGRMIYGIIGLVVIVGVWGLVKWVTNSFGLTNTGTIVLPSIGY